MSGTLGNSARGIDCVAIPATGTGKQLLDRLAMMANLVALSTYIWFVVFSAASNPEHSRAHNQTQKPRIAAVGKELLVAGYVGYPLYHRSNLRMKQPDGTDLELKRLGWDGDALHFPIDGGVRAVRWAGNLGVMVDFLHNKAIARLGKGAHGRKLTNPIIEEVEAAGTYKGKPAPKRIKLTKIFDRLEFTHGHNMLFLTGMIRLAEIAPGLRPYAGIGAGLAVPHVEVWFAGKPKSERTNEYQYAGPAAQAVVGLELQIGRVSYFLEYKFSFAWIKGALTTNESWKNFNMPGDLWRQFKGWWWSERPKHGAFSTTLAAHQLNIGAGYRWASRAKP